jgi:hypothetical protein
MSHHHDQVEHEHHGERWHAHETVSGPLDVAWRAAELALPEGWDLDVSVEAGAYAARAARHELIWPPRVLVRHGHSPADALLQLIAAIRDLRETST